MGLTKVTGLAAELKIPVLQIFNMLPQVLAFMAFIALSYGGDINRQSIVFHEETPDVFYCPQEKPISLEGMIVKAKPLDALCEHGGRGLPDEYKSDCWNDVDETEYACSEKKRILMQLEPPGSENQLLIIMCPFSSLVNIRLSNSTKTAQSMKKKIQRQQKENPSMLRPKIIL